MARRTSCENGEWGRAQVARACFASRDRALPAAQVELCKLATSACRAAWFAVSGVDAKDREERRMCRKFQVLREISN